MLNISRMRGPLIMTIFPLQKYLPERSITESVGTPMGRVKKIFVYNEYEPISKELQSICTLTFAATIAGMLVGGVLHIRGSVEKFIENNQATRFYNHLDAKRELQTSVMKQFAKGSYKLGWRAGLFTAIFSSIQTLLSAYYGKHSILHYMAGAGTAGFLFKMSLGLRGSLVGLIVGSILGAVGGFMHLSLLKITGLRVEDIQTVQQQWVLARDEKYRQAQQNVLDNDIEQIKLLYIKNEDMKTNLSMKEKKEEAQNQLNK